MKFELEQEVWFIKESKSKKGYISARASVEKEDNMFESMNIKRFFHCTIINIPCNFYRIRGSFGSDSMEEKWLFTTKQELLESL